MSQSNEFDFEYWRKLAKEDPAAFEKQRVEILENLIRTMPGADRQQRMRGLQWRIDMERKRAKNPMDATLRISRMMWDAVTRNYQEMQSLVKMLDGTSAATGAETERKSAEVVTMDLKKNTESETLH